MDLDIDRELTRRGALAGVLGAGVAAGFLSPVSTFLRQFAPLSGSVWKPARAGTQSTVDSPHGPAEVRYDDWGVPHVSADDEQALYFAIGYVHGRDRLFQLDLQRRLVSGTLSAVVGDATLDSDRFNRQMRFREAAEATVDHLDGTNVAEVNRAYADGVNTAMDNETLSIEFQLLDYEPARWTMVDSITIEKLIAWGLSGGFRTLRKDRLREEFGEEMAEQVFPFRYDTEDPMIRDHHDPGVFGANLDSPGSSDEAGGDGTGGVEPGSETVAGRRTESVGPELVDWLGQFEPSRNFGSNSWLVGPALAAGDAPLVSNDPHLQLQAPPIWQEVHLDGPDHRVRGVMFPGVPFVVIGENDHGAWGFTNTPTDVIDFYSYDSDDGSYQYGDQRREFSIEEDEIEVSSGENEQLELKRSVHGPVIEEEGQEVGVAWTGHGATETSLAIYELTHSEGVDEALAAAQKWEAPPQNFVYGDRDGNTRYQVLGRFPIRRVDGETVRGNQIFDGSDPTVGWEKFEPFERPQAWEEDESGDDAPAFVPFAENPHVENPDYIGTANQLIADDDRINYYLGWEYTSTYRSRRLYELLDERVDADEPIGLESLKKVGQDTVDSRAAQVVPENEDGGDGPSLVAAARDSDDDDLVEAAEALAEWDYRMDTDSEAALIFDLWVQAYWDELFEDALDEAGIEDEYDPPDQAVVELPPDSGWFGPEGREATMRAALRTALDEIDEEGHEVYGDVSTTSAIEHPLHSGAPFLSYPDHPRAGSEHTLQNFDYHEPWGSSWMMQVDLQDGGEYLGVLAGANSGRYFSTHYDDQVSRWADANYRSLSREIEGDLAITMEDEG